MKIEDGTGAGYRAAVSKKNRMSTDALVVSESVDETFNGNAYNVNTGSINLTSATASGVLYAENTGTKDIVITSLFYLLGSSTGGSGDWAVDVYRNPTTGTLISAGTSFDAVNRNFGSANSLGASVKKGAQGSTITDGSLAIQSILSSSGRYALEAGAIVLNPGNSIAFEVTPPSGNTSVNIQVAFSCYERES